MNCERFKRSIDDYLEDRLDGDERRIFRSHLRSCELCRSVALSREPSLLTVASVQTDVDDRAVTECIDAVTAMIRQERLRHRLAAPTRRWLAAAAMCALVLGGGMVWRGGPWRTETRQGEVPTMATRNQSQEVVPPPRVEVEMPQSEVTVYQFAGSDSETAAVYFIVNQNMEL